MRVFSTAVLLTLAASATTAEAADHTASASFVAEFDAIRKTRVAGH